MSMGGTSAGPMVRAAQAKQAQQMFAESEPAERQLSIAEKVNNELSRAKHKVEALEEAANIMIEVPEAEKVLTLIDRLHQLGIRFEPGSDHEKYNRL